MIDSAVTISRSSSAKANHRNVRRGLWVLTATVIGSSIAFIDGTVVNVALPEIQNSLNASVSHMQWVVEAYGLFLASLILVGGSMGDRFGRRKIYALGIVLFAIASLLCGIATDITQLITARAIQGVGGAMLVPGSLSLITSNFHGKERGRAIGTWSGSAAMMTALGPVIGGWLVEHASWRWVFYMNIPLALLALGMLFAKVPESHGEQSNHMLDWRGALFATLGLGGLVFGLIESSNLGIGDPLVMASLLVGAIGLLAFIWVESQAESPMMPMSLFRSRTFSGANLMTLLLYGALYGVLFFMPFNLIQIREYAPFAAGAAFLPAILSVALVSRWAGGLINRIGMRPLLIIGSVITAIGYGLFATVGAQEGRFVFTLLPGMLAMGLGMGICVAPVTTAVMNSVHTRYSGVASGLSNAFSYVAGLLAIAILGIVILFAFNRHLDQQLETLEVPAPVLEQLAVERFKLAAAEVPATADKEMTLALSIAIEDSFIKGFRLIMWIAASMAVAAALIASTMIDESTLRRSAGDLDTEHVGFI